MTYTKILFSFFAFGFVLFSACARAADATQALSVGDFLDSIGVCTHVGQGIDDPTKAAEALKSAGISNIRDDGSPRHVRDWIAIHQQAGVKVVLTRSGPNDAAIASLIDMSQQLAAAGALLALEGPNEPNNWAVTHEGKKSGGNSTFLPVAKWQAAFYAAAKSDPALKDYPVFASSEAGGSEPDNVGLQFLSSVETYDPITGTTPIQEATKVRSLPLTLSDHPVIVEMP